MKTIFIALITAVLAAGLFVHPTTAGQPLAQSTCKETYIIRRGDSLGGIARKCGLTLDELLAANPNITTRTVIQPGMLLRIVAGARVVPLPDTYTVKSGDTLGTIAERHDTTIKELLRLNPQILNPRLIYINQVLRLPGNFSGPRLFLSDEKVKPGWYLEVKAAGFPPNTDIDFLLSKAGAAFYPVEDGHTDADGNASVYVTFPTTAVVGEQWSVAVQTTETRELMKATSQNITIIK